MSRYVCPHPVKGLYYATSKTGVPLKSAVFARDTRKPDARWERVALVEDRRYHGESHFVNGSWVPFKGPMSAYTKAEQVATFWRETIRHHEVVICEFRPVTPRAS